ncbi:hypothetical protein C0V72_02920 [Porphyrobacter sp. TH134]|uniref:M56 family metallopeptidase n=1 Tax=Porphyrobacter sp. TH134 TaxID=2067450 RepID=UPI000C7BBD4E|nr:M56 family metallopeptidase [Porphyrobacter sp. TH134]PLK24979.1 hypothetical protein C0V72_02920 [Porphyrobacter sp. TH134]
MTGMLLHTLAWTGVLIALVLAARRPVTRHFGPEAAYALWALPFARLVLPPVTLPGWMAPAKVDPAAEVLADAPPLPDAAFWQAATPAPAGAVPAPLTVPMEAAPPAGFDLLAMLADWPFAEAVLLVWLAGAAVTLWRRFAAYFRLRADLLADARAMGSAPGLLGKVRLIETPATGAPLAMGVLDPVIALPPGFLALHDREARDLALAHELAHHRGADLLVNVLVQPLFALHWFNPLGRYGWLALRRDQEAACDARVMARRSPRERAAYAALIARFAALPGAAHNAALTAPMACPVLGEKSIIHRLRSLAMSDLSPRRRWAGRALLGAGLLALPLTASISYAAGDQPAPAAPAAPEAPLAPQPPAPPAAPAPLVPVAAPESPEAPWPVQPPEAPEAPEPSVTAMRDREMAHDRQRAAHDSQWAAHDAAMTAHLRRDLAQAEHDLADVPRRVSQALADAEAARAEAPKVMVLKDCTSAFRGEAEVMTGLNGRQTVMICQPRIPAAARLGLEQARAEIARDPGIPEQTRAALLQTLDRQIARWAQAES